LYLHIVLGIAVSPYERKITTRNIPKAFEAAKRTGRRLVKSTFFDKIKEPKAKTPTSPNIP